ncbi:MAG: hypothetical protein BWY36_00921 [Candidatus Diapherotrites archaeon ADurb.Bin253]|nr:MAG: hypothetical protein BWY36_00921 [Candidatus Diapherotrites archaeon ADurb.Bin253]
MAHEKRLTVEVNGKTIKNPKEVKIKFGPHFFVKIDKELKFTLGATHHGFTVKGDEIDGELEKIINTVREKYPDNIKD